MELSGLTKYRVAMKRLPVPAVYNILAFPK
jgi:hypothetical protein